MSDLFKNYSYYERIKIRKNYEEKYYPGCSPYDIGIHFYDYMSPIERNVWKNIRANGLVTFFPQYPVLSYFIDFADPENKIGIEIDSIEWHKNKDEDKKRQIEIEKLGWKIYRFNGCDTFCDIGLGTEEWKGYNSFEEFIKNLIEIKKELRKIAIIEYEKSNNPIKKIRQELYEKFRGYKADLSYNKLISEDFEWLKLPI